MRALLTIVLTVTIVSALAKEPKVQVSPAAPAAPPQDTWTLVPYADRVIAPEATPEIVLKSIAAHIAAEDYVAVERAIAALIEAGKPEVIASAIEAMIRADQAVAVEHAIKALIAAIEADKSGEVAKVVRQVFNRWDATGELPDMSHAAAIVRAGRRKEQMGNMAAADKLWTKLLRLIGDN